MSRRGVRKTRAILHVGFSKCGSSALQTSLSQQPALGSGKHASVQYVALHSGHVLGGRGLTAKANQVAHGYIASASAAVLAALSAREFETMASQLRRMAGGNGRLVMSCERWAYDTSTFSEFKLLPSLQLDCEVVLYVRPAVDWVNSAWWQWGAWTGMSFADWIENELPRVRWYDHIAPWHDVAGVEKVTVRVLSADIVSDFCAVAGTPAVPSIRANSGLPGSILRVYQRHPELRPTKHDSLIDFVLARHLSDAPGRTPWILSPKMVRRIIDVTRDSNLKLLDLLDADSRSQIESDPRWWDHAAYAGRVAEPPDVQPGDSGSVDALAARALACIFDLDKENRKLRRVVAKSRRTAWSGLRNKRAG